MYFDKKEMLKWWSEGYETGLDAERKETFHGKKRNPESLQDFFFN